MATRSRINPNTAEARHLAVSLAGLKAEMDKAAFVVLPADLYLEVQRTIEVIHAMGPKQSRRQTKTRARKAA